MTIRVNRRYTSQPTGPAPIDWTNPFALDLVFATYAEEGNLFRDMVNSRFPAEGGGSPAFNSHAFSQWGRAKPIRGNSYSNRFSLSLGSTGPESQRGKSTLLVLCVPRITNGTGARYIVGSGESSGAWTTARVGMTTGDYIIGNCVNGAVLQSDAPAVLGNLYAIAYTNYGTATPTVLARQRLYVNGVKQSAEGSYTGTRVKFIDYLSIGGSVAGQWDIYAVFQWARELTPDEVAEISANPYQLFARQIRIASPYREVTAKYVRGLTLSAGTIRQLAAGELGSGRVLRLESGNLVLKSSGGPAVVLESGVYRTIKSDEQLLP